MQVSVLAGSSDQEKIAKLDKYAVAIRLCGHARKQECARSSLLGHSRAMPRVWSSR